MGHLSQCDYPIQEQEDEVESNADTEANTNETFVDEQGNDTGVTTDKATILIMAQNFTA